MTIRLSHRSVSSLQAAYYVATGLWSLVHLPSFEAVTGPKVDHWLVRTFGALVTVAGAALAVGAQERRSRALVVLGAGSALALASAEIVYVLERRISRVYLLDAAVELALAAGWLEVMRPGDSVELPRP
jgi:hypothetical protein